MRVGGTSQAMVPYRSLPGPLRRWQQEKFAEVKKRWQEGIREQNTQGASLPSSKVALVITLPGGQFRIFCDKKR